MPDSSRHTNPPRRNGATRLNIHDPGPDAGEEAAYYDGIGAELRAERLRCGLTLDDVSSRLRIRISHLEAIEAGRFGDLPGRIYAIGFLRSYAEFLGADGDVCVGLFKQEAGPGGHSRKLSFPVPADENRRPALWTLLVSVVLTGAIYAGWVISEDDAAPGQDLVSEVPARFTERIRVSAADQTVGSAQAAESTGPFRTAEAGEPEPVRSREIDLAVVGREPAPAVESDVPANAMPVPDGTADSAEAAPLEGEAVSQAAAAVVEQTPQAGNTLPPAPLPVTEATIADAPAPAADAPAAGAAARSGEETRVAAAPPPVPTVEARDGYVPRVLGVANRDSRVIVRATEVAQIIVKQKDGRTLMPHRVMQPGDIYRAPNLPDVLLESNNIGSLQILLDGRLIGRGDRLSGGSSTVKLDLEYLQSATN
ncbi:MAG: helix-turn-helix domain-containing protein [Minwuia sp.]|uniref:helix-turn-helix domain-containing protein n=1 Tax=Minwuia sp. TaxID=2493630 RepID=UPI003A88EF0C